MDLVRVVYMHAKCGRSEGNDDSVPRDPSSRLEVGVLVSLLG